MICTSYFNKLDKIPLEVMPVSITGMAPYWYKGLFFKALIPPLWMVRDYKYTLDQTQFIKDYNNILNNLDAHTVLNHLRLITKRDNIALISNEKPNQFSHRKLVREWFDRNNIPCIELKF